ncbi:hypothetical protein ABZP36_015173 [Zizania latifolia]
MGPWSVLLSVALLLHAALASWSDFPLGDKFTVQPPRGYRSPAGFTVTATVLNASASARLQTAVAAAIRVVAGTGDSRGLYTCSLVVLMGDVTVWTSEHSGKFSARYLCRLELTQDGDLRLTDGAGVVGWSSGTAQRRAKVLRLESTGNLILQNARNHSVWQSFDQPMDKLVRGQRIRLPFYLTVPVTTNSTAFYSLEFEGHAITANLYVGLSRYTYWELTNPSRNRSMAFAGMVELGLQLRDRRHQLLAQIWPAIAGPVSFLALGHDGNMGMYVYDRPNKKFMATYKALEFCELPLACGLRGVCSAEGKCDDFSAYGIQPAAPHAGSDACNATTVADHHYMAVMKGVTTVLSTTASRATTNLTMDQCVESCLRSCWCAAALYVAADSGDLLATKHGACSHFELTAGAREVTGDGHRYSYWVKVPAIRNCEDDEDDDSAMYHMLTNIMIIFGTVDVFGVCVFAGLCTYYCIYLRQIPAVDKDETDAEDLEEAAASEGGGAAAQDYRRTNDSGPSHN